MTDAQDNGKLTTRKLALYAKTGIRIQYSLVSAVVDLPAVPAIHLEDFTRLGAKHIPRDFDPALLHILVRGGEAIGRPVGSQ